MSEPKPTLCCIKYTPSESPWISGLREEGFNIESLSITEFREKVAIHGGKLKGYQGILLDQLAPSAIQNLLEGQNERELGLSTPLIWCGVAEEKVIEQLLKFGIYEFLNPSTPLSQLKLDLTLGLRRGQERVHLLVQSRENALRDAARETAVAQREEFLNVCAHDLRAPLGLIQSSISLILNTHGKNLDPMVQELLTRSRSQSQHATQLVSDLLDVMSFEQGLKPEYEVIALDSFLRNFHKDYKIKADEKGVRFTYLNPIPSWKVLGDKDRILQLLQNLFINALKFTDTGKNICLEVSSFQGRRKADPSYPMIIIKMKDEGRGIAEEKRQHIFSRFAQIKDYQRADGRGLGLSVAKQISALHSGNVWVNSEVDKGSCFNVLFPHVISRTQKETLPERKRKLILVVEPSDVKRKELFTKLDSWNYDVKFASDGVEAVAESYQCLPDAVLLTANLARLSENEVCSILRSDPVTEDIGLLFGAREKNQIEKIRKQLLVDGILEIPFTKIALSDQLKALKKRYKSQEKKAA